MTKKIISALNSYQFEPENKVLWNKEQNNTRTHESCNKTEDQKSQLARVGNKN